MLYVAPGLAWRRHSARSAPMTGMVALLAASAFVVGAGTGSAGAATAADGSFAATFVTLASSAEDAPTWGGSSGSGRGLWQSSPAASALRRSSKATASSAGRRQADVRLRRDPRRERVIGVALSWTEPTGFPSRSWSLSSTSSWASGTGLGERRSARRGRSCGDTGGDPRAARCGAHGGRHGCVRGRADGGRALLAHVPPLHVLLDLLLAAPGQVGFEAEERGVQIWPASGCSRRPVHRHALAAWLRGATCSPSSSRRGGHWGAHRLVPTGRHSWASDEKRRSLTNRNLDHRQSESLPFICEWVEAVALLPPA